MSTKDSKPYYLQEGDKVYTTGATLMWRDNGWKVVRLDGDTYFDGMLLNDINGDHPHTGSSEEWEEEELI